MRRADGVPGPRRGSHGRETRRDGEIVRNGAIAERTEFAPPSEITLVHISRIVSDAVVVFSNAEVWLRLKIRNPRDREETKACPTVVGKIRRDAPGKRLRSEKDSIRIQQE